MTFLEGRGMKMVAFEEMMHGRVLGCFFGKRFALAVGIGQAKELPERPAWARGRLCVEQQNESGRGLCAYIGFFFFCSRATKAF